MVAPVIVANQVYGILRVEHPEPNVFSNDDLRILDYFSDLGAIILENLYYLKRIEDLAITDGITGLYVHRYMIEKLQGEIRRYKEYNIPVSIIMLDIDNFKLFNDTYGHPFGDQVLINVSKIIKQTIRETDFPVRYGGDEFVIILPQTNLLGAKILAERLFKKIRSLKLNNLLDKKRGQNKKIEIPLTISMSVGTYRKSYKSQTEFLNNVDNMLYVAKRNGKNRIEVVK